MANDPFYLGDLSTGGCYHLSMGDLSGDTHQGILILIRSLQGRHGFYRSTLYQAFLHDLAESIASPLEAGGTEYELVRVRKRGDLVPEGRGLPLVVEAFDLVVAGVEGV